MPFIEHFELLSLLHFDVVETWAARESGSGRTLLLHRYPKTSGLREKLQAMPLDQLARILKAGEDGDYFFVVTKDAPEFRRFLDWVDKAPTPGPPVESAPVESAEPGEFTRIFQAPKIAPMRPAAPAGDRPEASSPPPAAKEPGDFTKMFRASVAPLPVAPPAPSGPSPVSGQEPGEFTRLFNNPAPPAARPIAEPGEFSEMFARTPAPAASPMPTTSARGPSEFTAVSNNPVPSVPPIREIPPIEAKPAAPSSDPGEFSQLFGRTNPSPPSVDAATKATAESGELTRIFKGPQRPTSVNPPLGAQQPSEFTKLFNNPMPETRLAEGLEKPPLDAKPAARFTDPGDFSKMFGRPNQGFSAPEVSASPQAANTESATGIFSRKAAFDIAMPQAPMGGGPSDYTRIFQSGTRPPGSTASPAPSETEQKPAAPAQPPAKQGKQTFPVALVIVLAAIAVVAIALILYFVIKRWSIGPAVVG